MRTKPIFITPDGARQILEKSINYVKLHPESKNRKVSHSAVTKYAMEMRNGSWQFTHQGILIGKDGLLADGQHRLMAVIQSNIGQWFLVTVDEAVDSVVNLAVDRNIPRKTSFVIGRSTALTATATFALEQLNGQSQFPLSDIRSWVDHLEGAYNQMTGVTKKTARGISQAPVILAGVVRIMKGEDAGYIRETYDQLVCARFAEFFPLPASFYRQIVVERVKFNRSQVFARAMRMFDHQRRNLTKIQIMNEEYAADEAREVLRSIAPAIHQAPAFTGQPAIKKAPANFHAGREAAPSAH